MPLRIIVIKRKTKPHEHKTLYSCETGMIPGAKWKLDLSPGVHHSTLPL